MCQPDLVTCRGVCNHESQRARDKLILEKNVAQRHDDQRRDQVTRRCDQVVSNDADNTKLLLLLTPTKNPMLLLLLMLLLLRHLHYFKGEENKIAIISLARFTGFSFLSLLSLE